jgi:hypothetical protein
LGSRWGREIEPSVTPDPKHEETNQTDKRKMKKSKVTKITKFDKKPGYNDTSFSIEFENGDKGYYSSKVEDQKSFIIGQEAEYNIEEKTGKNNTKYYRITSPLDPAPAYKGGGGGGKPQVEPRIQMISFAMSYCKDLIIADKVGMHDMEKEFGRIYNVMTSKI